MIKSFSRGIPRLINILCDFALLTAFVEGREKVELETVREVTKDLETRDYWNTAGGCELENENKSNEDEKLSKVAGDLALKIINVEGAIEHVVDEISSLKKRLDEFENIMSGTAGMEHHGQKSMLAERVEQLEKAVATLAEGKSVLAQEKDRDKPVAEELIYIKNLISDIDHKLKKI